MNQTFDFHRFRLLLRLELAEKGKNYLLMGGLLVGLMLVMMLPIVLISNQHNEILMVLHALALFMVVMFGGSLYTSSVFNQYGSPDTGIASLMIPASQLEKFLISLLINLLFIIPVTIFFIKFHYWSISYANEQPHSLTQKYAPIPADVLTYFIYLHMVIQGSVFMGSIYFRTQAYIKTAGILFLTSILACIIYLVFAYYATNKPSKLVAFPFGSWKVWYSEANQNYHLVHSDTALILIYAFPIFFLLSTWFISYVRLKEKEI
ncbi:hypothetical protein [Dyadobacter sp. CY312]|uniref:hypothetical protein n=1 Tax=Dyadobacter sp. CY312 TaxID=2907303 RepID=UPI001F36CB78|nr:hypothetical protein [Dyadobacter sp. CY312]MCE7040950.1 hypothetical protein [Dyadobacter sp. CY312]